jgi:hypothetical protein
MEKTEIRDSEGNVGVVTYRGTPCPEGFRYFAGGSERSNLRWELAKIAFQEILRYDMNKPEQLSAMPDDKISDFTFNLVDALLDRGLCVRVRPDAFWTGLAKPKD